MDTQIGILIDFMMIMEDMAYVRGILKEKCY